MNKHTATLPDGRKVKRVSQNRVYTHLVTVMYADETRWRVAGWCSLRDVLVCTDRVKLEACYEGCK